MKKPDELLLRKKIKEYQLGEVIDFRKLTKEFNIPEKRMNYLLDKLNVEGILNCGVSQWFSWREK